ncbi:MAG: signal peptidase I [Gemmatimonadetes bacterium]|nr:signal peptidase I [Gemmatimonadota bacterium]
MNKLVYGAGGPLHSGKRLPAVRTPARGDVLVFQWPSDPSKNFVKRLVGVPGDTLSMTEGIPVPERGAPSGIVRAAHGSGADPAGDEFRWQRDYLVRTAEASTGYHPSRNNWGPLVVPAQHLFVLGDNRDNSSTRATGASSPIRSFAGRPWWCTTATSPIHPAQLDFLTRVRWHRLGDRVC